MSFHFRGFILFSYQAYIFHFDFLTNDIKIKTKDFEGSTFQQNKVPWFGDT